MYIFYILVLITGGSVAVYTPTVTMVAVHGLSLLAVIAAVDDPICFRISYSIRRYIIIYP